MLAASARRASMIWTSRAEGSFRDPRRECLAHDVKGINDRVEFAAPGRDGGVEAGTDEELRARNRLHVTGHHGVSGVEAEEMADLVQDGRVQVVLARGGRAGQGLERGRAEDVAELLMVQRRGIDEPTDAIGIRT